MSDTKFCSDCGEVINAKAEICPQCGVRQSGNTGNANKVDN
jgi:RNA polymerase subunit RPABC4/transcription elongation factor Spt4